MQRVRPFSSGDVDRFLSVIGIDEVGRGALCGPVVVAAVWFNPACVPATLLRSLDDSKLLSRARRHSLSRALQQASHIGLAASSAATIDAIGIRQATFNAMRRAYRQLNAVGPIIIDGCDVPEGMPSTTTALIKADGKIPQVAAASIIAKTVRDKLMSNLAERYPDFQWQRNAGYGTPDHLAALLRYGPTKHHRQTFKPMRAEESQ